MHPYPKGERGNSFLAQGAAKASQGELVKGSIALRPTPIPANRFVKIGTPGVLPGEIDLFGPRGRFRHETVRSRLARWFLVPVSGFVLYLCRTLHWDR